MGQRIDLTGHRFGKLTAVERGPDHIAKCGNKYTRWKCVCDCGSETLVKIHHLQNGHTQSCGCIQRAKLPDNRAWFNRLIDIVGRNAAKRGYAWELTELTVSGIVIQPCHYCGKEPTPFNGLDRVDNAQGYVAGNVVSCCRMCNVAKNNHTVEEFLTWIERVHRHQKGG